MSGLIYFTQNPSLQQKLLYVFFAYIVYKRHVGIAGKEVVAEIVEHPYNLHKIGVQHFGQLPAYTLRTY